MPAALGDTVLGVVGLQTVHLAHVHARRAESSSAQTVGGVSIPNFPVIYGASKLPSATNATIGIITSGSVTQTIKDLKSFAASAGYPVPPVTTTVVGTREQQHVGRRPVEHGLAGRARGGRRLDQAAMLYNVDSLSDANLTQAYNRAVADNLAIADQLSLGACETDEAAVEPTQDQIFESAVAQGRFSVSSGDSGAYECGGTGGNAQSYPAVSPYVFAVGGTRCRPPAATPGLARRRGRTTHPTESGGAGGGPR